MQLPWELGIIPPILRWRISELRKVNSDGCYMGQWGRQSKLGSNQGQPNPLHSHVLHSPSQSPCIGVDIFSGLAVCDLSAGAGCDRCYQQGTCCSPVRAKGKRHYSREFWFKLCHLLYMSWKDVFPSLALNFPVWIWRNSIWCLLILPVWSSGICEKVLLDLDPKILVPPGKCPNIPQNREVRKELVPMVSGTGECLSDRDSHKSNLVGMRDMKVHWVLWTWDTRQSEEGLRKAGLKGYLEEHKIHTICCSLLFYVLLLTLIRPNCFL